MACKGKKSKPSDLFEIYYMNLTHTCLRDQIKSYYKQAGARTLGQLVKSKFMLVDHIYWPKEIIIVIPDVYKIDIFYS